MPDQNHHVEPGETGRRGAGAVDDLSALGAAIVRAARAAADEHARRVNDERAERGGAG